MNLRENKLENFKELTKLERFPHLLSLNLSANPIAEEKGGEFKKDFFIQSWGKFKKLKTFNKEEVTAEEIEEFGAERIQRIKDEEEAAREAAEKAA